MSCIPIREIKRAGLDADRRMNPPVGEAPGSPSMVPTRHTYRQSNPPMVTAAG